MGFPGEIAMLMITRSLTVLSKKMFPYMLVGMYEVTNHFLLRLETYSIGGNSYLVL